MPYIVGGSAHSILVQCDVVNVMTNNSALCTPRVLLLGGARHLAFLTKKNDDWVLTFNKVRVLSLCFVVENTQCLSPPRSISGYNNMLGVTQAVTN